MTNQQILDLADSLVVERFNNPKKDRTLVGYWKSGFLDGYRLALGLPINESKESLKESKDDLIQVTEDNPVFPYWVYDTHRKVLNDIFDMCFYKKKFDIFVTDIGNGDKVEIYIVNDDMTVILTKETANIIIHKINEDNKYLADLSYASSYKTSSEIDEYVDKRWYGEFLKDFLNVVYKY